MATYRREIPAENILINTAENPAGKPEEYTGELPVEIIPEEPEKPAAKQLTEEQKRKRRRVRAFRSLILRTAALVLVVYILFFHIVGLTTMPGNDMSPRVNGGDLLLFYRVERAPKFQDVVVIDKAVNEDNSANRTEKPAEPGLLRQALDWLGIRDPEAPPEKRFVCRVIAAPGDTVEITGERGLQVNGNTLIETAVTSQTRPYDGYLEYPVVLGEGEYFVLSDSRNGGVDSRCFGPVTQDEIQGVVITLLRRNGL